MEQKVICVAGVNFHICMDSAQELAKELNKEGFALTFATTQSKNSDPTRYTEAMLVFTK